MNTTHHARPLIPVLVALLIASVVVGCGQSGSESQLGRDPYLGEVGESTVFTGRFVGNDRHEGEAVA